MNWHISLRMHDIIKEIKFQGFQEVHGQYIGGLRLFADSENLSLAIIKKLTNLIGEFISRIVNISAEAYSPFYIVSGKKPLSSAKSE